MSAAVTTWSSLTHSVLCRWTWLEDPPPWLRPACCFASIIMLPYLTALFICFILTLKQSAAWAACVLRATTRKGRQLFLRKKVHAHRNSWLRPWLRVTWLEDFLTSKWPGSFTALGPPLAFWSLFSVDTVTTASWAAQRDAQMYTGNTWPRSRDVTGEWRHQAGWRVRGNLLDDWSIQLPVGVLVHRWRHAGAQWRHRWWRQTTQPLQPDRRRRYSGRQQVRLGAQAPSVNGR